ncbi:hypothetical protein AYI70_g8028 [Smittium culicis]|uniref:F-box domain-containing protein n=2 Tax=Smittium culicis TaxID=133412 RepID=A0A1R1XHT1_9FUNG|nr:hypothetical protein AYI70_g8028 [Smittium culicis]
MFEDDKFDWLYNDPASDQEPANWPTNILHRICSFLPTPKDKLQFSLVNSNWKHVGQDVLWNCPIFYSDSSLLSFFSKIKQARSKLHNVKGFILADIPPNPQKSVICGNYQHRLQLIHSHIQKPSLSKPHVLSILIKASNHLSTLSFFANNFKTSDLPILFQLSNSLKDLQIVGYPQDQSINFAPFFRSLNKISSLKLLFNSTVNPDIFRAIEPFAHKLHTLEIIANDCQQELTSLLLKTSSLKKLLIAGSNISLSDSLLNSISSNNPNLFSISLHPSQISPKAASFPLLLLKNLKHLEISSSLNQSQFPPQSLPRISSNNISLLILDNIPFSPDTFHLLFSQNTSLSHVSLSNIPSISSDSIISLSNSSLALKSLTLNSCTLVHSSVIESLADLHSSSLESLIISGCNIENSGKISIAIQKLVNIKSLSILGQELVSRKFEISLNNIQSPNQSLKFITKINEHHPISSSSLTKNGISNSLLYSPLPPPHIHYLTPFLLSLILFNIFLPIFLLLIFFFPIFLFLLLSYFYLYYQFLGYSKNFINSNNSHSLSNFITSSPSLAEDEFKLDHFASDRQFSQSPTQTPSASNYNNYLINHSDLNHSINRRHSSPQLLNPPLITQNIYPQNLNFSEKYNNNSNSIANNKTNNTPFQPIEITENKNDESIIDSGHSDDSEPWPAVDLPDTPLIDLNVDNWKNEVESFKNIAFDMLGNHIIHPETENTEPISPGDAEQQSNGPNLIIQGLSSFSLSNTSDPASEKASKNDQPSKPIFNLIDNSINDLNIDNSPINPAPLPIDSAISPNPSTDKLQNPDIFKPSINESQKDIPINTNVISLNMNPFNTNPFLSNPLKASDSTNAKSLLSISDFLNSANSEHFAETPSTEKNTKEPSTNSDNTKNFSYILRQQNQLHLISSEKNNVDFTNDSKNKLSENLNNHYSNNPGSQHTDKLPAKRSNTPSNNDLTASIFQLNDKLTPNSPTTNTDSINSLSILPALNKNLNKTNTSNSNISGQISIDSGSSLSSHVQPNQNQNNIELSNPSQDTTFEFNSNNLAEKLPKISPQKKKPDDLEKQSKNYSFTNTPKPVWAIDINPYHHSNPPSNSINTQSDNSTVISKPANSTNPVENNKQPNLIKNDFHSNALSKDRSNYLFNSSKSVNSRNSEILTGTDFNRINNIRAERSLSASSLTNNFNSQPQTISSVAKPVLLLELVVETPIHGKQPIRIFKNDDPGKIAEIFCNEHGMPELSSGLRSMIISKLKKKLMKASPKT